MPRLEFTRKTRAAIVKRADGACERCSAILKPGEGEVDHVLPCELGGEPTVANGRLLCRPCHREKTANDIRQIRKSDRQRDRHTGVIRPAGTIKSQGFPKTAKPDKVSKYAWAPKLSNPLYEAKETTT